MGLLTSIIGGVTGSLVDSLLGKVTGVFEAYFKKQISIEELKTQVTKALLDTVAEVEKSHAESLAKTYESFQVTMRQSPMVQRVWVLVVVSQLIVLVWHQMGIPALSYFTGNDYPSSGSTVEWSYALIGFMFGAGAILLRGNNPGGAGYLDRLKALVGR